MVTATVEDDQLQHCLQVPYTIRDEIRKKTSTSAKYRGRVIEYAINYSPCATWSDLAGELYYWECSEALAIARRFIKRTPGKCVYTL